MSLSDASNVRNYLFDISKIVEGATSFDHEKVVAYVQQLRDRLKAGGEEAAAKRIGDILTRSKAKQLSLAKATSVRDALAPVDSESQLTTADIEQPEAGRVPLFVASDIRQQVNKFVLYVRSADRLIANGVGLSASMLLYGPPGCGKTQLARFIAAELELPLITARTDGLISSYLGSTAKNLRTLFNFAASRPSVLFLDEFDALAKMRDDAHELGELKRVVISLLQNIDAMGRDHVLIAATNHDHLLDQAIWRRFAAKIELGLPDSEARQSLLREFLRGRSTDADIASLAAMSDTLSGAQLRQIAEDAVRDSVIEDKALIDTPRAIDAMLGLLTSANDTHAPRTLSEKIRFVRSRNLEHFTQQELSRLFGRSQSQVCRLLKEPESAVNG